MKTTFSGDARISPMSVLGRALVLGIPLLMLAGCGGDDDGSGAEGADAEDVLTVCTDAPYPPFEFADEQAPSGYSGFEIDLVQAMADSMGRDLEVKDLGFDAIQSGAAIQAGQCEMLASGLYPTPEREKNLAFSDPFYTATLALLVPADSGFTTLEDLAGHKLAVQQASVEADFVESNAPDSVEVVAFPGESDEWQALRAGTVDGIVQDSVIAGEHADANPDFVVGTTFPDTGAPAAFAVGKSNTELLDQLNVALQEMRDNGTYDELFAEYFPDATS